uniref:Proteolipid protein 2 n=1 Tax=Chelydra serpentina TaxID=8475 RepID=A0A8C3S5T2_CHESE
RGLCPLAVRAGCWGALWGAGGLDRGLCPLGLCIVILICYGASRTPGYTGVAIFEMVFSIIFFVIYTLGLNKQLAVVHWGWSDFIRALIGALLFLITSLIVVIGHRDGVFGLLAGILFAYDAYITFPSLRKSHTAAPTGPHPTHV